MQKLKGYFLHFINNTYKITIISLGKCAYSKIFKQARKDDVIVLLDGQGMDEQWAGYDYYFEKNNQLIQ